MCTIINFRRWPGLFVLCAFCISAGLFCLPQQAFAHASLVRSEPADGSVIEKAPASFALTFNEPTSPIVLTLTRPDSTVVALDRIALHDTTLDIEAPVDLGKGTYVLNWRVISEDGHPVAGSAVFSIGAPSARPASVASDAIDWPLRGAIWGGRIVLYLGLFIGVGGAFFINWIGGRSRLTSSVALWAMVSALIITSLSVGLQGLDGLGLSLRNFTSSAVWRTGILTSYGLAAIIAIGAFIAGAIATFVSGVPGKVLSAAGLVLVGLALASSGHASAAHPQWLTRPAVFLHATGIAFWAGSLIPLGVVFATRPAEAAGVLRRFSRVIPFALLPLVVAGIVLAVIQVRHLDAMWTTAYGRVLLVKLALLAPLFALAAINRFWLTESTTRGDTGASLRLRHSIRIEIVLVVAIFAVAAMWRFTPPPRAIAEAAAVPASAHIHTDKAMAEITIVPGRAGPVTASIMIMTGDFGPLDAKEVTLVLSNEAVGIEKIRRPAKKSSDGTWHIDHLDLPVPGQWNARVDILVSDFKLVTIEGQIEIRP